MSKELSKDAEALFQNIQERYGDRLTSEQAIEEVREGVQGVADASQALRDVKLENGDEPFFVFTPYRGDE